jgi:7-dehydrocholesterol reductase
MWGNKGTSHGLFPTWMRTTVGPLLLMAATPLVALLFVHANMNLDGSLVKLGEALLADPAGTVRASYHAPSWAAVQVLLTFAAFQLALMRLVPGREYRGPITPSGNVPVYIANGLQSFFITVCSFLLGAYYFKWFSPTIIYTHYAEMISAMCVFSFGFCALLFIKGLNFPSSADSGSTGNYVLDFYWGTELYPRIFGWDVKMFTNCRFGMMAWALIPISFAARNAELNGGNVTPAMFANVVLQLVYVAKVSTACNAALWPRMVGDAGVA